MFILTVDKYFAEDERDIPELLGVFLSLEQISQYIFNHFEENVEFDQVLPETAKQLPRLTLTHISNDEETHQFRVWQPYRMTKEIESRADWISETEPELALVGDYIGDQDGMDILPKEWPYPNG